MSVKTRIRAGEADIISFLDYIRDLEIQALMIHGRTLSQGFQGKIDYKKIKEARKHFSGIIIANGGIFTRSDYKNLLSKTEADGAGIAQGAMGRPWIFEEIKSDQDIEVTKKYVAKIARRHAQLAFKLKKAQGITEMRKHLCWYVRGLPGAREFRKRMVQVKSLKEIREILSDFQK